MYTVKEDKRLLNNYAIEPQVYVAEYPAVYEQRRYMIQGGIATLIVATSIFMAFIIS